jgi:hypothetical protein
MLPRNREGIELVWRSCMIGRINLDLDIRGTVALDAKKTHEDAK